MKLKIVTCILLFAAYLTGIVYLFPLGMLIDDRPFIGNDFPKSFYFLDKTLNSFRATRDFHAYDPNFYAGYELQPNFHTTFFYFLAARAFPFVQPANIIKWYTLALLLLAPILFITSGRWWGLLGLERGLFCFLTLFFFYLGPLYKMMWTGVAAWVGSLVLGFAACTRLAGADQPGKIPGLLAFGILETLALLLHPLSPLILLPQAVLIIGRNRGDIWRPILAPVFGGCLAALALSWRYIYITMPVSFLSERLSPADTMNRLIVHNQKFLLTSFDTLARPEVAIPSILILLLTGAGIWIQRKTRPSRSIHLVVILLIYLGLFVAAMENGPLVFLWGFRFVGLFLLWALLPISSAWGWAVRSLSGLVNKRKHAAYSIQILAVAIPAALLVAWTTGVGTDRKMNITPFSTRPIEQQASLIEWIQANTNPEHRVLFEDCAETDAPFDYRYALLAQMETGREFIGGPAADGNIRICYSGFNDGLLLNRPILGYSEGDVQDVLARLNIGWVLCWTDEAKQAFQNMGTLVEPMAEIGEFRAYRVIEPGSYFLAGSGRIRASLNRIEVYGVVAEQGSIILSYHYCKRLVLEGQGTIEPVYLGDDPYPFIRVLNPGPTVTLVYR